MIVTLASGYVPLRFDSRNHGMLTFGNGRITAVTRFKEQYAELVGAILRKVRQNIAGQAERTRANKIRWLLGTIWWVILSSLSVNGQVVEIGDLAVDITYLLDAGHIGQVEVPDICHTEALYKDVTQYACADCKKFTSIGWPALEDLNRLGVTDMVVPAGSAKIGDPNKLTAQIYLVSSVGGGEQPTKTKGAKKPITIEQRDAVLDREEVRNEVARCESREYLKAEVVVLKKLNLKLTMERNGLSSEVKAVKAESEQKTVALRQSESGREAAIKEVELRCGQAHKRERQRDRLRIETFKSTAAKHERERNEWAERERKHDVLFRDWQSLKAKDKAMQLRLKALVKVKESYKDDVRRLKGEVETLTSRKKQRVGEGGKAK